MLGLGVEDSSCTSVPTATQCHIWLVMNIMSRYYTNIFGDGESLSIEQSSWSMNIQASAALVVVVDTTLQPVLDHP
jgi:hypothetical protein